MFGVPDGLWTLFIWEVSAVTYICVKMGVTPLDLLRGKYSKGRDD